MLEDIEEKLEKAYQKREEVLKKRRDILPLCQEGVKAVQKGNLQEAEEKKKKAWSIIRGCESELEGNPVLLDKALGRSYQEYAELCITKRFIEERELPEIDVPDKYYLTGLGDAIGEIKRVGMDRLAEGDIKGAEEIEKDLENLYEELNRFSYPNSVVPNLKRKQDVAQKVINDLHDNIVSAKI